MSGLLQKKKPRDAQQRKANCELHEVWGAALNWFLPDMNKLHQKVKTIKNKITNIYIYVNCTQGDRSQMHETVKLLLLNYSYGNGIKHIPM